MDSFQLVTQTVFKNLCAAMPMRHTALSYCLRSSLFSTVAGLTMLGSFSGCGLDAKASIPAQVQAAAYVAAHGPSVEAFVPPPSPHMDYSFNPGWKFIKGDVTNADQIGFDDAPWVTISAPHTYNDVDSYTDFISHSGGDRHAYSGIAWYRKHFKLPASAKDGKVWLEFEGLKQAGRFWVNGKFAGKYENGVTPLGLEVTELVNFGDADNVIAVKVDNSNNYQEEATGTEYEWMGRAFNPNYGGLNHDIWLHLTGKVYQTLPLYENLQTTGVYVYPSAFDFPNHACEVNLESQVKNESGDQQSIILSAVVVDAAGKVCAKFESEASDLVSGETEVFKASGKLADAKFWSPEQPALYTVYSMLKVNDKVVDVQRLTTGFRKAEFKGGVGTGGVYLNDKFVWLTGYAQRSSDDWAGLGQAYPDWMHDYNAALIRSTHANYIRWMHISPQAVDVRACDRAGVVEICPAGDKEKDALGRQWDQRLEVMRDSMIYFRNAPGILFWEAGNNSITTEHLQQMVDLRKEWDPNGGRAMGCRTLNERGATSIAEYFGVMIGQDRRTEELTNPTEMFRAYSAERRDRAPFIETEDFRDEAARRFWDNYSPPHFGFKPGPEDTYHWNSESFCVAAAERYHDYFSNRISNSDPAHSRWAGYASIYWSDSNADGRQDSSEVCRVSGKVDSVRLPKEAYFVYRVMQSDQPDLHILGHWTYPTNTVKTVYVAANHCDRVELFVNGRSLGTCDSPINGYIFTFPSVHYEPGKLSAVAMAGDKNVADEVLETAGDPKQLKLTPHVSPRGLLADGADVAFFDVEVLDAQGRRCPTDEARVDFKLAGPAIWRGGYNSGQPHSVNNLWLDTECGINRVAVRSTLVPGKIMLTATRAGLAPAEVELVAQPVEISNGLEP
jgi:beta-galactosidase